SACTTSGGAMRTVAGLTVLVTGAGRGMGEIYARRAVSEGARSLILWDVDQAALEAVSRALADSATIVHTRRVDISSLDEVTAAAAAARAEVGAPDVLINNAGIVRGGAFWENDPATAIDATMRINAIAHMWVTREFLPDMIADT